MVDSSDTDHPSSLVSIVLPTHNGIRYIAESIESCLGQSYSHIEIIIVDDDSDKETKKIIDCFEQSYEEISVVHNETRIGLPASLNIGFKIARGQFLTWTSDDNIFEKEAIYEMVRYLKNHNKIAMVYCDYAVIDEDGSVLRAHSVREPANLGIGCVVGACFLYRRSAAQSIGEYSDEFRYAEDYEYWLRLSKKHQIATLHKTLYRYRQHSERIGVQYSGDVFRATHRTKIAHVQELTWMSRKEKARALFHMARDSGILKNRISQCIYWTKASILDPRTSLILVAKRIRQTFSPTVPNSGNRA